MRAGVDVCVNERVRVCVAPQNHSFTLRRDSGSVSGTRVAFLSPNFSDLFKKIETPKFYESQIL